EYGKSANKYADISFDATKQAEKLAYKAVEHIELALSYLETAKVDQSKVEGEITNAHTLLGQTIAESDKTNSDSHNARESLNEKLELLQRFNRTGGIA
ncbi:MAG: hypothetical protein MJK04_06315, partial [Psychrosphaera sp.]|nr:hypothetical protein [Psychrosphaera sp.]